MITRATSAGSSVVFMITGWYLRGQGSFHRDKMEYLWGQVMIALGMFILCITIWQIIVKSHAEVKREEQQSVDDQQDHENEIERQNISNENRQQRDF